MKTVVLLALMFLVCLVMSVGGHHDDPSEHGRGRQGGRHRGPLGKRGSFHRCKSECAKMKVCFRACKSDCRDAENRNECSFGCMEDCRDNEANNGAACLTCIGSRKKPLQNCLKANCIDHCPTNVSPMRLRMIPACKRCLKEHCANKILNAVAGQE